LHADFACRSTRSRRGAFLFTDPAPAEPYTLSLHDALPICPGPAPCRRPRPAVRASGQRYNPLLALGRPWSWEMRMACVPECRRVRPLTFLLLALCGCGGNRVLEEPVTLELGAPLDAVADERIELWLDWVVVRDGP